MSARLEDEINREVDQSKKIKMGHFLTVIDMHGVRSIFDTKLWILKLTWVAVLLSASAALTFGLYKNAKDYIMNPILTSYDIISGEPIPFPDIYLCPSNYVNYSFVLEKNVNLSWAMYFRSTGNGPSSNSSGGLLSVKQSLWDSILQILPVVISQDAVIGGSSATTTTPAPEYTNFTDFQDYFMQIGYNLDGFLQECAFQDYPIPCSKMAQPVFDKNYGKCFLISAGNFQTSSGEGFSFLMNIHTELYPLDAQFQPSVFDGVYLYMQRDFDPASRHIMHLSPGKHTYISLEAKKVNLINGTNRGKNQACVSSTENYRILNVTHPTMASCHMECIQTHTVGLCDCIVAVDSRFIRHNIKENVTARRKELGKQDMVCLPDDMSGCVWPDVIHGENVSLIECRRKCDPPCEEWVYKPTVTHMIFPSLAIRSTSRISNMESNLLLLDISFPILQYIEITQSASMTLATFVSNLGGQMGVWLGASLLTLLQLFMFIFSLCFEVFDRYKNHG